MVANGGLEERERLLRRMVLFASDEPAMIILGLGARQTVAWSREPRNFTFAPARRTTQQGSCAQWYQERPMAKRPLSQMTWLTISKPMRSRPAATSAACWPACHT
ncbi:MAG: hypothetical protein A2X23_10970 [Chloroflexi bacterium GWC2_73_18]|nr:MAG: hypothetical protein A2X23_10970 [Chloroflexi bacterium GWC2_73_18]